MADYKIAPSILSADFARLGEEVDNVLASGAEIVHFDVMDNHYVPNLTIGPLVCEALRKHGVTADIDVHMMVKPVDRIIPDFAKAGATYITFHPEASTHVHRTIGLIHDNGCKAGLVFNPATPLTWLEHVIWELDMVLIMSVNPGFGGQRFIAAALDKLRHALLSDRPQLRIDQRQQLVGSLLVSGSGLHQQPGDVSRLLVSGRRCHRAGSVAPAMGNKVGRQERAPHAASYCDVFSGNNVRPGLITSQLIAAAK